MLNFAANLTFLFTEVPFTQRFNAAAKAGFKGVEFLFPYDYRPEEISGFLKDANLELALFNLPPGDWDAGERGLAAVPGMESRFRGSLETALPYLIETGLKQTHVMAGCVDSNLHPKAYDTYLNNLTFATKILGEEGINVLIEPINTIDMPGYFLSQTEDALDIIRQVGSSNLKLQFDIYHRVKMGRDVTSILKNHIDDIAHIQIAGQPDRHEPIEYSDTFQTLESLNYRGWIGCEYKPRTTTVDGLGWRPTYKS